MSLGDVESWISSLAIVRASLLPGVPASAPSGQRLAVVHPSFQVSVDALSGDVRFSVRDKRYGWLVFTFTKEDARDLADRLSIGAAKPAPTVAGRG